MITQLVRKQILNMGEINWGDVPDNSGMRLMWGENQEGIKIYKKAILNQIDKVNLYPSPTKILLKKSIAKYNNVPSEFVIPTNGSDEALELIAKVFISVGDEVIIPVPSYPCFESVSQMMGAKIVNVPLEKDFKLNIQKIIKQVSKKTKIIWIANPNNPTGNLLLSIKEIEILAKKMQCLIVIDECYFELSGITASQLAKKYQNIIVTRSFTKVFALAGARLGYIIANPETAKYLNRLLLTNQVFNVNRFAQASGIAILERQEIIKEQIKKYKKLKTEFENKLNKIVSLEVVPTKTTFCFVKINGRISGKELKEKLMVKNIFIKDCSIYSNLGTQYIYLGIPLEKYQDMLTREIKKILEVKQND